MLIIKFLHLLALMMGAAASIANLVIASKAITTDNGREALLALRPLFSRLGLLAVLLIWITGVWLYIERFGGAALGPVFTVKIIAAALLLFAIAAINIAGMRAKRSGRPVPGPIQKLGPATLLLTLIAVAAAVWVFD